MEVEFQKTPEDAQAIPAESQKTPKYTQANIGTEGVRDIIDYALDPDGVLVADDHPIIELLQSAGRFDSAKARRWVRLNRELVQASCTALINDGFGLSVQADNV